MVAGVAAWLLTLRGARRGADRRRSPTCLGPRPLPSRSPKRRPSTATCWAIRRGPRRRRSRGSCRSCRSRAIRSSERTEVRVVYTKDTLYIGAVMYDREPDAHRRLGFAPRRAARRRGQLPRHLRHLPRPPERLRLRHQSRRGRVRRAGHPRRAGRRRADRRRAAILGVGERLQRQLGRRLAGADPHHRDRLERRVRHSVQDAAFPVRQRPDVGRQLPAHHPAPQRARLLGADPAPVQPLPGVAGRHDQRHHARRRCATSR